jgi:hypothetical protein
MSAVPRDLTDSGWIVSRRFDLAWFFGGALIVPLAGAAVLLGLPVPVVALLWIWLLCFDGPHMLAAYTRTYADPACRRTRRPLLWGDLAGALVAGPLSLGAGALSGSDAPFTLFLLGATLYGMYHVVRQHYGFLALYKIRGRDAGDVALDRWALYLACLLPYLHFLLTHPRIRALGGLAPALQPAERLAAGLLAGGFGLLLAGVALRRRRRGWPAPIATLYLYTVAGVYGLAYFAIAPREPVYAAARGLDQEFMLLSAILTMFHNLQYVGLVWLHNQRRYPGQSGLLGWLRTPRGLLLACLGFAPLYGLVALATGVYPGLAGPGGTTLNRWALCLWWGIALHHYVLGQRIWRLRGDPELRAALGLSVA